MDFKSVRMGEVVEEQNIKLDGGEGNDPGALSITGD